MIRTQIQLEEVQYRRLKELAHEQGTSIAQLVRDSVDQLLTRRRRDAGWQRLWEAVGTCHDPSGVTDVSAEHDQYLERGYSQ